MTENAIKKKYAFRLIALSEKIVLMTNGPSATIGEILDVKLARSRDRLELAVDTGYHHYRQAAVELLHSKQNKAAQRKN